MVPIGLAIALFWGFVIAALNDDPVSIDKKQIAVKTLASEVEAARAEVIKQREAAAAYAATLHAAHAEALAVLNESRREDAAAAEKRFAEADEAHAAVRRRCSEAHGIEERPAADDEHVGKRCLLRTTPRFKRTTRG